MASETRATAESIRESAREVRAVYRAGRSLDGDDVGNVAHDLEDAAAEIARLTRELEEARERERAHRQWIEAIAVGVRVLAHESEPGPEGAVIVSARNLGELQHGVARALATPPAEGGSR